MPGASRICPGSSRMSIGSSRMSPGSSRISPGSSRMSAGSSGIVPDDPGLIRDRYSSLFSVSQAFPQRCPSAPRSFQNHPSVSQAVSKLFPSITILPPVSSGTILDHPGSIPDRSRILDQSWIIHPGKSIVATYGRFGAKLTFLKSITNTVVLLCYN